MPVKTNISQWSKWMVASIEGHFTAKALVTIKTMLDELEKNNATHVAMDLSQIRFLDTTAIQLMINFGKRTTERGGKFKIISPSADALDILKTLCINELMDVCISRESFERTC